MPKFHENFIKSYDEDSDRGYILEVDAEYPKGFTTLQLSTFFTRKNEDLKTW